MPVVSADGRDGFREDMSLYAPLWEYKVLVMALDHFFNEVVEGNVPLDDQPNWWDRSVVTERVNRYSQPWCLLFDGLAMLRQRIDNQMPVSYVEIDQNLKATYDNGRSKTELTWTSKEDR